MSEKTEDQPRFATTVNAERLRTAAVNVNVAWHHERRAMGSLSPRPPDDWWERIAAEYERLGSEETSR